MTAVAIDYDRRAGRFVFACECSWHGSTKNLSLAAQPIAEHSKVCDGKPPSSRTPYEPERHATDRIVYPKPPAAEEN